MDYEEPSIEVVGHDSPRFEAGSLEAAEYLKEHGYVIIKDVASAADVELAKQLFWDWAEGLPKAKYSIKRDDPSTWAKWPGMLNYGIISEGGIGQSAFLWHIRGLAGVRKTFEQIWGTDRLLTSFDGCGTFRPWSRDPEWKTQSGWWHVDQNAVAKPGMHCVQGLVTLTDGTDDTGNLCVIPRSHHDHGEVCQRNSLMPKIDFVPIDAFDPAIEGKTGRMLRCKAGDMLLWDSRTIHCNTPALNAEATHPTDQILRLVAYVCMTPRDKATAEVIEERKRAYATGVTTTHWPHEFHASGPGTDQEPVPLTVEQRRLVGFEE